jgi:hypothetical protein
VVPLPVWVQALLSDHMANLGASQTDVAKQVVEEDEVHSSRKLSRIEMESVVADFLLE